jgi:hypothetical protein
MLCINYKQFKGEKDMIQGVIQQLKFMTKMEYLILIEIKVMLKDYKIQLHAKVSKKYYLSINLFVYKF